MTAVTTTRTIALSPDRKPRARDPNLSSSAGATPQPTPGPLTMGPNRFTVRVPSNATKLNLGQGDTTDAVRFNKRPGVGTESGIVAQTDSHAHLHTFGTTAAEAKTMVRLGIPPTSVPPTGSYSAGASTGIGCLFPEAYSHWDGYSMVTQGGSYQESQDNHLIVSSTGEVRLVAKTEISLGTSGDVIIGATTSSTPKQLVQNQGAPTALSATGYTDELVRMNELVTTAITVMEMVSSYAELAAAFTVQLVQPLPLATGWGPYSYAGANVDRFLGLAAFAASAAALAADLALPPSPSGRVGIFAEKSATISANETITISAGAVASLMGSAEASLRGGVSASVSAVGSASVDGTCVTASGVYSATLESVIGGTTVRSVLGDVQLYTTAGAIRATSGQSSQFNSIFGTANVHGLLGSYLGCGVGVGMGVIAKPEIVYIGMIDGAAMFEEVSPLTPGMTILPDLITTQVVDSTIVMTPAEINVETLDVSIEADGIEIACDLFEMVAAETTIAGMVYLG